MLSKNYWVITPFILYSCVIAAQSPTPSDTDEPLRVTFSANLRPTAINKTASSVRIIDETTIANSGHQSVAELLSDVTGLHFGQAGANGGATLMIRGASSAHTLVMIDGVIVNDTISSNRVFDFSRLNLADIERIEVLKGAQGTLYGSDAMAGVVQIFTKKGTQPLRQFALQLGTDETLSSDFTLAGSNERWQYRFSLGTRRDNGISSAGKYYGNREEDDYRNHSISSNVTYTVNDWWHIDANLRYYHDKQNYDYAGGAGGDAWWRYQLSDQLSGQIASTFYLWDEKLISKWSYAYHQTTRRDIDHPDWQSSDVMRGRFTGKNEQWTLHNIMTLSEAWPSVWGLSYQRESGSSYYYTNGVYGPYFDEFPRQVHDHYAAYWDQTWHISPDWLVTAGFRAEDHSGFGFHTTYRLNTRYQLNDIWAIRSTYGTGFKAPTLYQRYAAIYGNSELEPEESNSFEIGVVGEWKDLSLEATWFRQKFNDLIEYNNTLRRFYNVSSARTEGVEVEVQYQWHPLFKTETSYQYVSAINQQDQMRLLRRPRHQVGTALIYQHTPQQEWRLNVRYTGSSEDKDFSQYPAPRVTLPAYWLVDAKWHYQWREDIAINAAIHNLFDERYETAYGYGQRGRRASLGVRIDF